MSDAFEVRAVPAVDQPTEGLVSHSHGETAHAAALEVRPRTGTQRHRVLGCIEGAGSRGVTRDAIAAQLEMSPNAVRPRVRELIQGGHAFIVPYAQGITPMHRPAELVAAVIFRPIRTPSIFDVDNDG